MQPQISRMTRIFHKRIRGLPCKNHEWHEFSSEIFREIREIRGSRSRVIRVIREIRGRPPKV